MLFIEFKLFGYVWNLKNLEIYIGDMVEWRWFFVFYIIGFIFRVVQVKDEVFIEELFGGFNSGVFVVLGNFIIVLVLKDIIYKIRQMFLIGNILVFFFINYFDIKIKIYKCGFIFFFQECFDIVLLLLVNIVIGVIIVTFLRLFFLGVVLTSQIGFYCYQARFF